MVFCAIYSSASVRSVDTTKTMPCFAADVVLSLPNIVCTYRDWTVETFFFDMQVIQPSLEDIQNAVNTAAQCVTDVGQYIQLWTMPSPASSLSNTPRKGESKIRY